MWLLFDRDGSPCLQGEMGQSYIASGVENAYYVCCHPVGGVMQTVPQKLVGPFSTQKAAETFLLLLSKRFAAEKV